MKISHHEFRWLFFLAITLVGCGTTESKVDGADMAAEADGSNNSTTPDMGATNQAGGFEIGTNPVGESSPSSVMLMTDGAEVPWTFGVQGSWMVVLAFRTQGLIDGPFELRANITIDGVESGSIWLEMQETFPGGDGWDYYYNLFLPIADSPPEQGTPVQITMQITDGDGTMAEQQLDLVAGPTPISPP